MLPRNPKRNAVGVISFLVVFRGGLEGGDILSPPCGLYPFLVKSVVFVCACCKCVSLSVVIVVMSR